MKVIADIAFMYMGIAVWVQIVLFIETWAGHQPAMRKNPWIILWASLLWPVVAYNTLSKQAAQPKEK